MKQETKGKIKADIHDFDRRLTSVFKRLNSELSSKNMLLVNRYYNAMIIDAVGKAVQEKHLQTILSLTRMYGKTWQDITHHDVENLIVEISKKYTDSKGQETHTSFDYKKILKIFVRWIKTGNRRKDPDIQEPLEIRYIRIRRVKDRLSREDLITETANYLTESQLRKRHGWSGSSKMPERYTHLVDSDVDKAVLAHYGLVKEDTQSIQVPKICDVCQFPNACDSSLCSKCGKPLDLKTAIAREEQEKEKAVGLETVIQKMQHTITSLEESKASFETYKEQSSREIEKLQYIIEYIQINHKIRLTKFKKHTIELLKNRNKEDMKNEIKNFPP
jgi:hypothetical protein